MADSVSDKFASQRGAWLLLKVNTWDLAMPSGRKGTCAFGPTRCMRRNKAECQAPSARPNRSSCLQ
eukprot:1221026-Amphidinium_carterae.1